MMVLKSCQDPPFIKYYNFGSFFIVKIIVWSKFVAINLLLAIREYDFSIMLVRLCLLHHITLFSLLTVLRRGLCMTRGIYCR